MGPVVTTNPLVTTRHLLYWEACPGLLLPEPALQGPLAAGAQVTQKGPASILPALPSAPPLSLLPVRPWGRGEGSRLGCSGISAGGDVLGEGVW